MGNMNCCEASLSKLNEVSLGSPKSHPSFAQSIDMPLEALPALSAAYDASALEERKRALKALQNYRLLTLRVINSGNLTKGTTLYIEPIGLQGALRGSEDGYTFFGSKKKQGGKTVNDFVIPVQSEDTENLRGRHYLIYYHLEKSSYWLRDLGKGFGVFVRLNFPLVLRDNMLVNLGESFLVINILPDEISLKLFSGSIAGDIYRFSEGTVTIGRCPQARLKIEDSLMSKIQCEISLEENAWVLTDGDSSTERESTNGTWLYLNEDFEIYDKMIFKTHQTLIQATVI